MNPEPIAAQTHVIMEERMLPGYILETVRLSFDQERFSWYKSKSADFGSNGLVSFMMSYLSVLLPES